MRWHIIEGEAGCDFARENGCVAVVVDALRASATAAMMLHHGATELLVVRDVKEARAAKEMDTRALLFGERGGVPPAGFDGGNSPQELDAVDGRKVIFTTTTGANRMVSAWGARAVMMGTTVNGTAAVAAAASFGCDVVLIPAGLTGDPDFNALEDCVAAVYLAMLSDGEAGEGQDLFDELAPEIEERGLTALFEAAPHAAKLRAIHMAEDIPYCAQVDLTDAVPLGIARGSFGIQVRRFSGV